jgi:hypothetical protein
MCYIYDDVWDLLSSMDAVRVNWFWAAFEMR